ncbi:MBL fold metallo-hydrolase [Pseudooceanicola aestuarii]|uniref:MBL fold metallo-hydrolase n=1 Tax=Pseudooceanicola aestuarii TaxID=2697319 RepID=UPI001EF97530|nr:MBL fold metallo-hydrolase [Pseudooceanicola aestuarii]
MHYPWEGHPGPDQAVEVAPGVLWLRLPLPMALDHVNVYALDDGDGWTLVDTGTYTKASVALWETLLAGPLGGRPVRRVLLTHHHPDHVGMAGWFMTHHGAELITSRTAWLTARMLVLDEEKLPSPQAETFWRRAGMPEDRLRARMAQRPFNFVDIVHPIPVGYTRLVEGDSIRIGGRDWDVRMGNGHAPEHVTLWSRDDNLVLGGDQLLPSISPNVGVQPSEPEADPLADWLEACERLSGPAREDQLVLGGHKLPFTGLPKRMHQLIENHHGALARLRDFIATPRTAVECFPPLFKRKIDDGTYGLALVEAVAHLNHLHQAGAATRTLRDDGAYLWHSI